MTTFPLLLIFGQNGKPGNFRRNEYLYLFVYVIAQQLH